MSARQRAPVPRVVVEVPVDELRQLMALLKTGEGGGVRRLVDAHCAAKDLVAAMFARPRRMPAGNEVKQRRETET